MDGVEMRKCMTECEESELCGVDEDRYFEMLWTCEMNTKGKSSKNSTSVVRVPVT